MRQLLTQNANVLKEYETMIYKDIVEQGTDVYLNSDSTVVIDTDNDALRDFLSHMTESLAQAMRIECERVVSDFQYNIHEMINRHERDIKDYINANICDMIKDKR
jgi:hypothetical protein